MLQVFSMAHGHDYWDETMALADSCSWKAGPFLARLMRQNQFRCWERVFAAHENGKVIGFCTLTQKDELPEIYGYTPFIGFVFVDEPYRGKRISEDMIRHAVAYVHTLGYEAVYLMSGEHGLYEKYGFIKMGDYETIFGSVDQLYKKSTNL